MEDSDHSGDSLGKPADAPVGATDTGIRWFRLQIEVICDSDESFTGFVRVSGPLELFPPNFGRERHRVRNNCEPEQPESCGAEVYRLLRAWTRPDRPGFAKFSDDTGNFSPQAAPASVVTGRETPFPEILRTGLRPDWRLQRLFPAGFQTEEASSYSAPCLIAPSPEPAVLPRSANHPPAPQEGLTECSRSRSTRTGSRMD
jgi:hypothetical protein